ncbi:hypothetical protein H9P43_004851 [Blastocladiella emersonii ATCC 22665]|nr:hypothetical protein H9P43_004851 [Blastocladiella emersonii ATCC 22665]
MTEPDASPFTSYQLLVADAVQRRRAMRRAESEPSTPDQPPPSARPSADGLKLSRALAKIRSVHRKSYVEAQRAQAAAMVYRDAAVQARLARLNRDWFKSHLEGDVKSYERADLEFNPPDLMSAAELRATLPESELAAFDALPPRDQMRRRFKAERLARMRMHTALTGKQNSRKALVAKLQDALARETARDEEALKWCSVADNVAKLYGIDLAEARLKRDAPPEPAVDDEDDDEDDVATRPGDDEEDTASAAPAGDDVDVDMAEATETQAARSEASPADAMETDA